MVDHTTEGDAQTDDVAHGAAIGGFDRRTFLGTLATGSVVGIAGCSGGGGDEGEGDGEGEETTEGGMGETESGDGGTDLVGEDVGFRLPVEPSPNYVIAFVAQKEGFWEDAGITPLTPEGGNGSGDTTRRVATQEDVIGHADVTPQVSGIVEQDYDIIQFGTSKAMTQSGLIYRTDRISDGFDPDAVAGATITAPDTLDEQTWIQFRQGIGAPDNVTVEYVETSSAASLLQQGEIDGIWDSINDYAAIQDQLDVEIGFAPLFNVEPLAGYFLIVNGSWFEENDQGVEWLTGVLEGYSAAGKWTLLNPESAIETLIEEVPELGTTEMETNLRALAAGVAATNFNEGVKENGFGYIDPEVQQNTFDTLADLYDLGEAPNASDVTEQNVIEQAELATFSDSEWDQVREFASPYTEFFES